ncbi:hypothetical protein CENSYa_0774 [Cenarchaeum symbiosum A]|uniref:Uncharacterized protein n=1 Tax=Cenarchaeum symbiosum (strain A) TaxID=414004 RepID=A0RVP0_CENSY|nr:hypothetical protein CENSYa_0774 [Cenarchaeum symbiosum A]
MPTMDCKCGVRFYSSGGGTCPRCRYGEFGGRIPETTPEAQCQTGPREELVRSVVHTLQRVDGKEKLDIIICFVCKLLEARHIMPPFQFKPCWSRHEGEIATALENLSNEGSISTVRHPPGGSLSFISKGRIQDKGDSEVDLIVKEMVETLGGHSASEITDLLYLHFPRMKLSDRTRCTDNDIARLFPSYDRNKARIKVCVPLVLENDRMG